jgi:phage gpG-like protein
MMDPDAVLAALSAKAEDLREQLLAKVQANLSGDVLQERSGALKASIVAEVIASTDAIDFALGSDGVPYAAIQEYGGTTPPHEIVPVKARALAFAGAAGPAFARRVRHPGSRLPARSYLASARDALGDEIGDGLKAAVLEALGAA